MESEISFMKNDKCAIETPKGFTVLEIIDAHIAEKGDIVSGDLHSPGHSTLRNETKDEIYDVFIEDIYCSRSVALSFVSG